MPRLTQTTLAQQLKDAAKHVLVGQRYRHYKGQEYKVIALAFEEASMQIVVVYQAQYGASITFTRPLALWDETVIWEGRSLPRFAVIEK